MTIPFCRVSGDNECNFSIQYNFQTIDEVASARQRNEPCYNEKLTNTFVQIFSMGFKTTRFKTEASFNKQQRLNDKLKSSTSTDRWLRWNRSKQGTTHRPADDAS